MSTDDSLTTALIPVALRAWQDTDLPLLERLMSDPAMTRYVGGPETSNQIHDRHAQYLAAREPDQGPMYVIQVGAAHASAGAIGYWLSTEQGRSFWETGWGVLPEFQRLGVATRAALLLLDLLRRADRFHFLHALPSLENVPSNAVCRKAGFVLQGQIDLDYPPGRLMRCNDWCIDLFPPPSA